MLKTMLGLPRAPALALMAALLASLALPVPGAWARGAGGQAAGSGKLGSGQGGSGQEGANPATPFRPVAVVNGSAITGYDLEQRAQMRKEALNQLIDDRLEMQEGKRLGIKASPEDIKAGIAEMAKTAGTKPDKMMALFSAQGISRPAVEDMVRANVVWREVVRQRFASRVEPGEAEISAELNKLKERSGEAYQIAEIGLPLKGNGRTPEQTKALAERLSSELSLGGDFEKAVRRYSRAPSASKGGQVGWVTSSSLPPHVAKALAGLNPGDVSKPIKVAAGYSILKVLDKRAESGKSIDSNDPELRRRARAQLANQEGARLAEGLLQQLRRDALIQTR
jgi:peptidyl-prolyl cis-trans isomerase SurA